MKILISTLFTLTLFLSSAQAGILIDTTRIIYPAAKQEVTLNMTNNANSPRLIQTWVDDGGPDSNTDNANMPLLLPRPFFALTQRNVRLCVSCILAVRCRRIANRSSGLMSLKYSQNPQHKKKVRMIMCSFPSVRA